VSLDRLADMCEAARFNLNKENLATNFGGSIFYNVIYKVEEELQSELNQKKGRSMG